MLTFNEIVVTQHLKRVLPPTWSKIVTTTLPPTKLDAQLYVDHSTKTVTVDLAQDQNSAYARLVCDYIDDRLWDIATLMGGN